MDLFFFSFCEASERKSKGTRNEFEGKIIGRSSRDARNDLKQTFKTKFFLALGGGSEAIFESSPLWFGQVASQTRVNEERPASGRPVPARTNAFATLLSKRTQVRSWLVPICDASRASPESTMNGRPPAGLTSQTNRTYGLLLSRTAAGLRPASSKSGHRFDVLAVGDRLTSLLLHSDTWWESSR